MFKTGKLVAAMAIATLAMPAMAGSWPNVPARKAPANAAQPAPAKSLIASPPQSADGFVTEAGEGSWSLEQYRYFQTEEGRGESVYAPRKFAASKPAKNVATTKGSVNGYEYVGGEAGWQLAPHKFVWSAGRFAHSDECDHVIRTAMAPTPAELDSVRKLYPGG